MMEQAERFVIELVPMGRMARKKARGQSAHPAGNSSGGMDVSWAVPLGKFFALVLGGLFLLALVLPALDPVRGEPDLALDGGLFHRVIDGDSLHELARRYYRDPRQWQRIFLANRNMLVQAGRLVPGVRVFIPPLPERDY